MAWSMLSSTRSAGVPRSTEGERREECAAVEESGSLHVKPHLGLPYICRYMRIGATYHSETQTCDFRVWAPYHPSVSLHLLNGDQSRWIPMQADENGYWHAHVDAIATGTRYRYHIEGKGDWPDPASQSQPDDVHGASGVVDHDAFTWQDGDWRNLPFEEWIIYELHVGTFTPEGTFTAIIPRLGQLHDLGVNVIELMPVAQFPGDRNWGYDGVYPFAVQHSYGGVEGLKQLVNACHQAGIAVVLDVVYNHLGPEGNYTSNFAPYVSHRYHNPWGHALNFDDADCQGVRHFFIENALYWLRDFHLDGLRLDAINTIYDFGAKHFLAELANAVDDLSEQLDKPHYLIAESDLNDVQVLQPQEQRGYGMTAQWTDDFHRSLHALLTGEQLGFFRDFGHCQQLAKSLREGFVFTGEYSQVRKRKHGNYAGDRPPSQFVVYAQNHDQIGNRMLGDRLSQLVSFEALKLAAGAVLLSPNTPMLFMGEEYGEIAPFLYFVSHSDPHLVEAVRHGRKREFAEFHISGEPPDPAHPQTFEQCILNWHQRHNEKHGVLYRFYQTLIQMRRSFPALKHLSRDGLDVSCWEPERVVGVKRAFAGNHVSYLMNFNLEAVTIQFELSDQRWHKQLDSADLEWQGIGSLLPDRCSGLTSLTLQPHTIALYRATHI
jgi:maltooligosyltrehalose trehalohydrolase